MADDNKPPPAKQEEIVDNQPKPQEKKSADIDQTGPSSEVEELVRKLAKETDTVKTWSTKEVVQNFLVPVHLGHLEKYFYAHKVTGSVLIALTKYDIQMLGLPADTKLKRGMRSEIAIGDRVYLNNMLETIRKGAAFVDLDRVLWKVRFPIGGYQYYDNWKEFCCYKCCAGCMERNVAELTLRGLTHRQRPPRKLIGCCVEFSDDFMDFRFLKDVDHKVEFKCCCNRCPRNSMVLTFLTDSAANPKVFEIAHPILNNWMADEVKSAWAELRLVADD